MTALIKLCGLTTPETLDEAIRLRADFAGLVFFPASPRHVGSEQAEALARHAAGRIPLVAVTVDADDALLARIAGAVRPAFFQLHGAETPRRAQEIRGRHGIPVIKALPVREAADLAPAHAFAQAADMLLFDAKPPSPSPQEGGAGETLPGGNGLAFDWTLLQNRAMPLPWLLSGGLTPANVAQALRIAAAPGVDVSSGIESAPGVKDAALMQAFVAAARNPS